MATKKNHYYVLVLTSEGPVFVTGTKPNHYAEFNKNEAPKEFTKEYADDISIGLTVNFITAYTVCTKYEISGQPYFYGKGHFEWKWNEEQEEA